MEAYLLVRLFHELALKGKNRPFFLEAAFRNIQHAVAGAGVEHVRGRHMRAILTIGEGTDLSLVRKRLSSVFGVEKIALAYKTAPDMEAVKRAVDRLLEGRAFSSFRITAQRADKSFPLNSQQINVDLGAYVKERTGATVDLEHPGLNIHLYILYKEAFISFEEWDGPGGMPVGVGGKVLSLLSGGIDSPVAAWRMMRRGCEVLFVHFHSFPLVEGTSREKAMELARLLTQHQFRSTLFLVPFGELQKRIIVSIPPPLRVVLYRRFMFRIAQALAERHGAQALVTGDSLGQVSSQTLENMAVIGQATTLPVLRPWLLWTKRRSLPRPGGWGPTLSPFFPTRTAAPCSSRSIRHSAAVLRRCGDWRACWRWTLWSRMPWTTWKRGSSPGQLPSSKGPSSCFAVGSWEMESLCPYYACDYHIPGESYCHGSQMLNPEPFLILTTRHKLTFELI